MRARWSSSLENDCKRNKKEREKEEIRKERSRTKRRQEETQERKKKEARRNKKEARRNKKQGKRETRNKNKNTRNTRNKQETTRKPQENHKTKPIPFQPLDETADLQWPIRTKYTPRSTRHTLCCICKRKKEKEKKNILPNLLLMITSGARYCVVCMSSVKCFSIFAKILNKHTKKETIPNKRSQNPQSSLWDRPTTFAPPIPSLSRRLQFSSPSSRAQPVPFAKRKKKKKKNARTHLLTLPRHVVDDFLERTRNCSDGNVFGLKVSVDHLFGVQIRHTTQKLRLQRQREQKTAKKTKPLTAIFCTTCKDSPCKDIFRKAKTKLIPNLWSVMFQQIPKILPQHRKHQTNVPFDDVRATRAQHPTLYLPFGPAVSK